MSDNPALDAARGNASVPPSPANTFVPLDSAEKVAEKVDGVPPVNKTPQPPPENTSNVPPTPDSVVALAEMVTMLAVKSFCVSRGVKITNEIEKLCTLTQAEKRQLETLAPFAMPWILKILNNLPVIGAVAFFGVYAMMLGTRYSVIKKYIPVEEEKKEEIKTAEFKVKA